MVLLSARTHAQQACPTLRGTAGTKPAPKQGDAWTTQNPDVMKDPKCILQQPLVLALLGTDLEVLISLEGQDGSGHSQLRPCHPEAFSSSPYAPANCFAFTNSFHPDLRRAAMANDHDHYHLY